MKKKLYLNSGFTLVELLVALTLVMIVIVAVVGLASVSIKTSYRAKGGTEAKRYAEEAMEWLRQEKDQLGFFLSKDQRFLYELLFKPIE